MFRNFTLFLVLVSFFSLQANSDAQSLPSLSFLEKAGIKLIDSLKTNIPQSAAVTTLAVLGSYSGSSVIIKKPLFRALTSLAAVTCAYKVFDYYSWGYQFEFVPGTLFNTHPLRLARDWNKYLKMDACQKNALLDEPYPAFLTKLYTNAQFYDHPIRESNKLAWLEEELQEVAKMSAIQQKWQMLKVKRFALSELQKQ